MFLQYDLISRVQSRRVQYNKRDILRVLNQYNMEVEGSGMILTARKEVSTKEEAVQLRKDIERSLRTVSRGVAYIFSFHQ